MAHDHAGRSFLPAANHDLFLPFYDPFTKIMGAGRVRRRLVEQAALGQSQRVLEIGCGTGSLLIEVKRRHPDVEAVGLDPDAKALDRARRKARRMGVGLTLDQGFSNELLYPDATFDRVFSCLMFHHVDDVEKDATLREVRRVLKPGGRLELVDLAGPHSAGHGRSLFRLFHSHAHLKENSEQRILSRLSDTGFSQVRCVGRSLLVLGPVLYFQASAPG